MLHSNPHFIRCLTIRFMIIGYLCLGYVVSAQASERFVEGDRITNTILFNSTLEKLSVKIEQNGKVRVIVGLNVRFTSEGMLSSSQVSEQRNSISGIQSIVEKGLAGLGAGKVVKFKYIPYMAMEITSEGLSYLNNSANVLSIEEDHLSRAFLADTIPLIGADKAWQKGYSGQGQSVAIIDTGVDNTHSFLKDKVIEEACFSTTSDINDSTTLCPNGRDFDSSKDSGMPCPIKTVSGCNHGTHVAGIAAGKGEHFSGVAKDATIISLQVFSSFEDTPNNKNICSTFGFESPCILSYSSDQIRALERIYELKDQFTIAAVNMSIGDDTYSFPCDSDSRKPAIDNLKSVGIPTVVSSGNLGQYNGICSPACISSAISVGSTSKSGAVSSFSNSAYFLDLLAPGESINSSVGDNRFESWDGTSMSSPHVSGAWAIIKSKTTSGASVDEVLTAFKNTGVPILDKRNDISTPRVQVDKAIEYYMEDAIEVVHGQTIKDFVGKDNWKYYKISVGAFYRVLSVSMLNLSDDIDLYVFKNKKPDKNHWECRPYKGKTDSEKCYINNNGDNYWYIGVHGYRQGSYSIKVELIETFILFPNTPLRDSLNKAEWKYYTIRAIHDPLSPNILINLKDVTNDLDLYVKTNSKPDHTTYDCRPYKGGLKNEQCVLPNPPQNKDVLYYIGVYAYLGGEYTIDASYKCPPEILNY